MEKICRSATMLYRLPRISNLSLRLNSAPATTLSNCYIQCRPFKSSSVLNSHSEEARKAREGLMKTTSPTVIAAAVAAPVEATVEAPVATSGPPVVMKWEQVTEEVIDPRVTELLTGAIIPFSQQNVFQWIVFPYTFAVMYYLDLLTGYMPWWMAIVGTTATIRLLFFPLVLKQNIIGIKMYNLLPESQKIQVQINEAMCTGDQYQTALARTKLKLLYDDHKLSIMDRLWPTLIQIPAFMSVFFLLRRLATEPVEALLTGGAMWFTNLTVPDPFYVLPLLTCTSTFLLMQYGLEGGAGAMSTFGPAGRWMMRILPFALFPFVYHFPAAVLLFWTTNNFFTLFYALLLKNSFIKKKLNIPIRLTHDPASLPLTNQTFSSQIKTAMDQGKSKRTTLDVRRLDDIAFRRAGVGPLRKTYKTSPSQGKETLKERNVVDA